MSRKQDREDNFCNTAVWRPISSPGREAAPRTSLSCTTANVTCFRPSRNVHSSVVACLRAFVGIVVTWRPCSPFPPTHNSRPCAPCEDARPAGRTPRPLLMLLAAVDPLQPDAGGGVCSVDGI